jgi:DNA-binding MarR family transcriptional regulator
MQTQADWATVERIKARTTLQLLFQASRMANELAIGRVQTQPGGEQIRTSHTLLFPHIEPEGTRITTLAQRVGVSKQAVSQLVDDLVESCVLERVADPSDRRAKLVRFTPKGREAILHGLSVLDELAGEIRLGIGQEAWDNLHASLQQCLHWLRTREEGGCQGAENST